MNNTPTVPQLADYFERMCECEEQAQHNGHDLQHGSFANRTAFLVNQLKSARKKMEGMYTSVGHTLLGYMQCQGIEITPETRAFVLKKAGNVVSTHSQRKTAKSSM